MPSLLTFMSIVRFLTACLVFGCSESAPGDVENDVAMLRIAVLADTTGRFAGKATSFMLGIRFVADFINGRGGVEIGSQHFTLDLVSYDTESSTSQAAACVMAAAAGQDMAGKAVGHVHLIVAATASTNRAIIAASQVAGIPNIHISGGDPSMWKVENNLAFGMHMPYTWYTRGLLQFAKTNDLRSILIIRSRAHGFAMKSGIAALHWARQAKLEVFGPSLSWCRGQRFCRILFGRCICGEQATLEAFGYHGQIHSNATFYDIDESTMGNGLVWGTNTSKWGKVDPSTTEFVRDILRDARQQGREPDIVLNFATEWHNVLNALWLEDFSPKMLLGWHGGTMSTWAVAFDEVGQQALNETHGLDAIGFGQWHKNMQFSDPLLGSNDNASLLFSDSHQGKSLEDYDTAGAMATGVVIHEALRNYVDESHRLFNNMNLSSKREVIRVAIGSMNDMTMWGVVRFGRNGQNIGRGTAAWQIQLDELHKLKQRCVLPLTSAEVPMRIPFRSWNSRFGCPAGAYNNGHECLLCQAGRYQAIRSTGLLVSQCSLCNAGTGTSDAGSTACPRCMLGRSQDNMHAGGICRDCGPGMHAPSIGLWNCVACRPGRYVRQSAASACSPCPPGKHQDLVQQNACRMCRAGKYSSEAGSEECQPCPQGHISQEPGANRCVHCSEARGSHFTTKYRGSSDPGNASYPGDCISPSGMYENILGLCMQCPPGVDCELGTREACMKMSCPAKFPSAVLRATLWAEWRLGETPEIYRCRPPSVCPGGPVVVAGQSDYLCAQGSGRTGRACGYCGDGLKDDITNPGVCTTCGWMTSTKTGVLIHIVLSLLGVYLLACIMGSFYNTDIHRGGNSVAAMRVSSTFTLLVTFSQQLAVVMTMDVEFPEQLRGVMDALQVLLLNTSVFSFPCTLGNSFKARYLPILLLPFVMFSAYFILRTLLHASLNLLRKYFKLKCFWHGWLRKSKLHKTLNICGIIINMMYIGLVKVGVSIFECVPNPAADATVKNYPQVICFSKEWQQVLPVALILGIAVYSIGWMALCIVLLWLAPKHFGDPLFRQSTGFLYVKFRKDRYWWSVPATLRNLLLGLVCMAENGMTQLLLALLVDFAYINITILLLPWEDPMNNGLDLSLSWILAAMLTVFVAGEMETRLSSSVVATSSFFCIACGFGLVLLVFLDVAHKGIKHRFCIGGSMEHHQQKLQRKLGRIAILVQKASNEDSWNWKELGFFDRRCISQAAALLECFLLSCDSPDELSSPMPWRITTGSSQNSVLSSAASSLEASNVEEASNQTMSSGIFPEAPNQAAPVFNKLASKFRL